MARQREPWFARGGRLADECCHLIRTIFFVWIELTVLNMET
jgi:hypothetical protein